MKYILDKSRPLITTAFILSLIVTGCGKSVSSNAVMDKKTPVETQVVKLSDVGGGQIFSGQITPETLTNVASKLNGKITLMEVHIGDRVKVGQDLATIDTSQLQQQLQQTQSTVALDQAQLIKTQSDHDNSISSEQQAVALAKLQLDKAQSDQENNIAQADKAVAVAQATLDKAKADHASALSNATSSLNLAQSNYNNSTTNNDNQIKLLKIAVDQAQTAYQDALNYQEVSNDYSSYQTQANIDNAYSNWVKARLQLEQAQASSTSDAVLNAQLQQAEAALQNAQNSKDVEVATANYNQAQEKLNELHTDLSDANSNQQHTDQSTNNNQQTTQSNTSSIDIAKAQLAQAQQSLNAAQSTDSLAISQAQLNAAETNVQVINEQLQDGVLTAPVNGIVTAINAPVGQMAGGQGSVVTIASTEPTIATVNVPEAVIGKIKAGTSMYVQIPTLNKTMEGKVLRIHPMIDSVTKSYGVDIQVDDPDHQLLPGMFAEASLKSEGRQAVMVPADAVLSEANGNAVFIVDQGKAKKVLVQIGEMTSTQYEITSGLKVGEQIVVKGEELLSDGASVDIVKPGQSAIGKQSTDKQATGNQSADKQSAGKQATGNQANDTQAANMQAASKSDKTAATGGKQ